MSTRHLETLIWVLIYAGLSCAGLGIWFIDQRPGAGWGLFIGGCSLVAVGALLIWLRSRRP